jgi:four helix bundle protein
MARLERCEEVDAWKVGRERTKSIYQVASVGEFARDFGLRDQIRRAAVSILSNIAEGFERGGNREFLQFLPQAKGSRGEVRAQLYVAVDQSYLDTVQFQELREQTTRTGRLIAGLMKYLSSSDLRGSKYR